MDTNYFSGETTLSKWNSTFAMSTILAASNVSSLYMNIEVMGEFIKESLSTLLTSSLLLSLYLSPVFPEVAARQQSQWQSSSLS